MKKIFAILMAAAMLLTLSVGAFAESYAIEWADIESAAADVVAEGTFYQLNGLPLKYWAPNVFTFADESTLDENTLVEMSTADNSNAISVQYIEANGESIEDLAASLPENGATEIEIGTINGLGAVTYTLAESDVAAVVFATESGNFVQFLGYPASDADFSSVLAIVFASIQAA